MHRLKLLLILCIANVAPSDLEAQACLGLPSFLGGAVHVNGYGEFADSATVYSAGVSGGTHDGVYGTVGAGQVDYEGFDEDAALLFLELGLQYPIGGAQLCPLVGGYLGVGPDDPEQALEVTSYAGAGGLSFGYPFGPQAFRVIPNASIRYQYTSQTVEQEEIARSEESFQDGWVDLGLGFVIADRLGIQPLAHIPISGDSEETTFGIFLTASIPWQP